MSIATTAPQKFELQDLACIELMLRFALAGSATFTVESGVEDGDLVLGGSPTIHYEIQVKGSDNPVSIDLLAKWLLHFPAYRDDETVLQRLLKNEDRWFVLVASGRCRDDLEALRVGAAWQGEAVAHVPQDTATKVITAFGAADPDDAGDTDLHTRRIAHRDRFKRTLRTRAVAKALRRVVVLEQATRTALEAQIQTHLVRRGMPLDRIESTILALRRVVEAARGDGADVMDRLNARLHSLLPGTLLPEHYVRRGNETALLTELTAENSLLLSGISRSGKSVTARWLGAQFENQGFEVRAFRDIQSATSFLEDPVSASRLAVLDDPLGRVDATGDSGAILSRLEWLVSFTRPDRRLIVAQGQEALLEADDTRLLADIETGRRLWHDLGDPGATFLRALWRAAAAQYGFPVALIEPVAAELGPKPDLGAGALDFLARSGDRFRDTGSVEVVMRFARRDAKATGQSLRRRLKSLDTIDALLLVSSEQDAVDPIELAFVQGQGGETLPAYTTHHGRSSRLGSTPSLTRPLPSYDTAPATDAVTRADLDFLERLHVIDIDRSRRIGLSHGFYRQAFIATLANPTTARADGLLEMHRRGLFARSGPTSKASARNLDLLVDLLSGAPDGRGRVFRTAIEGLSCYFLATRDLCFDFLMRNAAEASGALEGSTLNSWISAVTYIDFTEIQWHGDDAIYPIDGEVDGFMNWAGPKPRSRSSVQSVLGRLAGDEPLPSAREASEALTYLWHNPGRMTRVEAERLFSLDEAIIRREAAFRWLSQPRMRDEQLLKRFERETHPLVIIGIYQGIRKSLRDCEPMRREQLIRLIETLVGTPVGALALMDYLIIFERDYHRPSHRQKDDRADWRLFARVFPKAVAHLPAETRFDTARFQNVLYEALGKIPARAVVRACAAWLDWLIRVKASGYFPGEFVLSFVGVLMRATKQDPTLRGDLLVRALATTQTDLLLAFLSDAIDAWADLTPDERDAVLAATTAKAPDARWRRAVALTREVVPSPVEMALLPFGTCLASGAGALRTALPEPILAACLSVHCGRPYPVSIVSRADRTSVWETIARAIATEPGAPYIGTLFDHVAHSGDVAVFCGMVREGAIARPQETFALLMAESMWRNNEHLGPGWETLLAHAPNAATRDAWLDDIANAGPKIFEEWTDIDGLFPSKRDAAAIRDRLKSDTVLIQYVGMLMQLDESNLPINPDLWHTAIRAIGAMVEKLAPVILGLVDKCIYRLRGMGTIPPEVEAQIDAARARIIDAREPIWRKYRRKETIFDWVG